jgi:hypothetical protein
MAFSAFVSVRLVMMDFNGVFKKIARTGKKKKRSKGIARKKNGSFFLDFLAKPFTQPLEDSSSFIS